ncbi:serine/threonine protein kinase [Polytolypa hystricis UAMH7299]|uniref:Serine/threonine protein kinase n=1 Tax=Polytolypa hystricis (strain UAMH7299) TaxID=1447883 RepID=A0A2B7YZH6_POLH7|nr:serine/threonine protein kinase [Polytolypa hystricis UAMH7299]
MGNLESSAEHRKNKFPVSLSSSDDATHHDHTDMARLGKEQQFKRNFRYLSTLGFTCTLMATWESILLVSTYGLINGGMAGMVYIYVGSFVGFFCSVASMAEMASISPTSGGQYHWVSEFAGESWQKFMSYITGWISVLGWQAAFASICFLCGTLIQGLLILNESSYVPERWHGTFLTAAIAFVGTFVNTYLAGHLPSLEGLILIIHIFGFFATMIPLWVMADRTPTEKVFTEFVNAGGWPSLGVACLVGQLTPIFSFLGPDAATHIAEEIKDASKIVPWCMISTALINGGLGFIMLITFLFTLGDVNTVLEPETGFSFISGYMNATGSKSVTTGLACIILVLEVCSAIGILATCSRQTFAFGRDNALPFSAWFAHINQRWKIPLNAIMATTLITILLSLINIGSTAAFNAIASLTVASLFLSYILSIGAFIYRRLQYEPLPLRRWSLGKYGLPINVFSFIYLCFAVVFTFFPTTREVTAVTMNWSIVVFMGVLAIALVQYFVYGRHQLGGRLGTYRITKQLSEFVYSALNQHERPVVIESVEGHWRLQNERDILKRFQTCSTNLRPLLDEIENPAEPPAVVLQHLDDDLTRAAKRQRLTRQENKHVAKRVLEALRVLHENGYIYAPHLTVFRYILDIKPSNILVNYGSGENRFSDVQLADCGGVISEQSEVAKKGILTGTNVFRAPEAHLELPWGTPSDIWSFGVTLINQIWGLNFHLFEPENTEGEESYDLQVLMKHHEWFGPFPHTMKEIVDEEAEKIIAYTYRKVERVGAFAYRKEREICGADKAFILRVMKLDPTDRKTAAELLNDEWFTEQSERAVGWYSKEQWAELQK